MEKQNSEDDRFGFLAQFRTLFLNQKYDDAWVLAQNRMRLFPLDVDAYAAAGEVLMIMGRKAEIINLLSELKRNIAALSAAHDHLLSFHQQEKPSNLDQFDDALIGTLSNWLNNISRMKSDDRDHK